MSTPSKTPDTDAIIEYLRVQFPATEGHIPLREKIGNLERESIDCKRVMFSSCSGYIAATEVAGKAIVAMEQALKAGIAHSRRRMEESLPRLKKELNQCRLDHQGPVHINSNVRLFDLVRFMRSELHQAELITDEEYSWLCAEAELATAPEGGSPSPRRLEDYDDLRKQLSDLARWKREALEVESWWQKIDAAIRVHPDAVLGRSVADEALRFIKERDDTLAIKHLGFELIRRVLGITGEHNWEELAAEIQAKLAEKDAQIVA